jgi:phosphatidate phosphatase PAH1
VEGVDDSGGRVYFEIPADKALGPGRHRAHLVVQGDLSSTEVFIEVIPKGTPMFVSDVDGTLTDSENAEFTALLTGQLPGVHPDAAQVYDILVSKGYHPMYLTARPEWLMGRTREFLDTNGFPHGIVHTTLSLTGATGAPAATFKTDELALVASKGMVPAWAIGNTATDAEAYDNAGVMPIDQRVFYQFDDTVYGGRRIEAYSELLAEVNALPSLCP